MVVVLGSDVDKKVHTAVAVDEVGREIGQRTVRATDAGHRQLLGWALRSFGGVEMRFAVEDCRHVSTRLERALLGAGQAVVRVPAKLMAGARASARTRGKSDPIDALAIARAALREPGLPVATHDAVSREVRLLVDHREDLVNTRTQMQNRLRWHLHELDPELDPAPGSLDRLATLDRLVNWLGSCPATSSMLVRIAAELVADIRALSVRVNALEREISERIKLVAPRLPAIAGSGPLTAAKIVGEIANVIRFRSEACVAMHAGAAPIPASSGKTNRHPPARGGNRQLNAALHRIAVTQIRLDGAGRDYYRRRIMLGNTKMRALRARKRRLARVAFTALQPDTTPNTTALPAAA
jgi:transposase